VCLSLDYMFRALPGALGNQPVAELYPSLLKRLDDSSDDVRYAVCKAFKSFFGSAPVTAFRGTCIDYTLDQLFVHLDDMDEGIQSKFFEVIIAALPIDAPKVIKKANSMRNAHRSPHYIDQIVAAASGR
jgi:dynein assembly factor 5